MDLSAFFTVLATLSAASQTILDVLIKKWWPWLAEHTPEQPANERKRVAIIHVLAAVVGGVLVIISGLTPLKHLGIQAGMALNAAASGVLVSFGGGFLNDLVGVLHELKASQEALKLERRLNLPKP